MVQKRYKTHRSGVAGSDPGMPPQRFNRQSMVRTAAHPAQHLLLSDPASEKESL